MSQRIYSGSNSLDRRPPTRPLTKVPICRAYSLAKTTSSASTQLMSNTRNYALPKSTSTISSVQSSSSGNTSISPSVKCFTLRKPNTKLFDALDHKLTQPKTPLKTPIADPQSASSCRTTPAKFKTVAKTISFLDISKRTVSQPAATNKFQAPKIIQTQKSDPGVEKRRIESRIPIIAKVAQKPALVKPPADKSVLNKVTNNVNVSKNQSIPVDIPLDVYYGFSEDPYCKSKA